MSYIYLIQEREHIRLNEPTYKIGKTHQKPGARMGAYPKDSSLKIMLNFDNCDTAERQLLAMFKTQFIHKPEYGHEYFSGDVKQMLKTIMKYWHDINSTEIVVYTPNVPTILDSLYNLFKNLKLY